MSWIDDRRDENEFISKSCKTPLSVLRRPLPTKNSGEALCLGESYLLHSILDTTEHNFVFGTT